MLKNILRDANLADGGSSSQAAAPDTNTPAALSTASAAATAASPPNNPPVTPAAKPDNKALVLDILKKHNAPATSVEQETEKPVEEVVEPVTPVEAVDSEVPADTEVTDPADPKETDEPVDPEAPATDSTLITDKPEDAKLPFHKHPRFQEVIRERNESRESLKKAQPLIDQATQLNDFRSQNRVGDQTFQAALQIAALMENDPKAALEALRPHVEALQMWNGEKLPDDLQAQVAAGTLPLDAAKELSIARLTRNQQASQHSVLAKQQQELAQRNVMSTLQAWAQQKATANPDFKPKANATAPDGPWEYCNQQYALLAMQKPVTSPADAIALAEKSMEMTQSFFKQFRTAPKLDKRLVPTPRASTNAAVNNKVVTNSREATKAILAGVKVNDLVWAAPKLS